MEEIKLLIIEQDFITSSGKKLSGVERVVECPMLNCKVNVRKNCGKCLNKVKLGRNYILCKYKKNF